MTPTQFKRYLKRHELSQKGIAEKLGVSRNTIQWYLGGEHPIPTVFQYALKGLEKEMKKCKS